MSAVKAEGDVLVGVAIVKRALEEPARQIITNAGQEGSVIVRDGQFTGRKGYGRFVKRAPAGFARMA